MISGALLLASGFLFNLWGNETSEIPRKQIHINRANIAPKVDGILDDPAWENSPMATGFVERKPTNGNPIPENLSTEVKIVYDNLGIYFAAQMKDPEPGNIRRVYTERDNLSNNDYFSVLLNGYNDRQQSMQFSITAAGVQYDAKIEKDVADPSWNAIWYSEVSIHDSGWTAEIFIPYSELRFPEKAIQEWGLNMERELRREGILYTWNKVDNSKGNSSLYDGEIHGIENIKVPSRLAFMPYVSSSFNHEGSTTAGLNGGVDLKYGLNNAFSLDLILVPDFNQAKFDNTVLNLSAFEVQYDEQRAFFTEGTELFAKGGLFYSRRIGGTPSAKPSLKVDEEFMAYPSSVDLLNATKVSGRTETGLGVGFLNAITNRTYASIKNTSSGEIREELVEPIANYNVLVLDKRFDGNSSVSLINTSTLREGGYRDANVTGIYADLTNRKNTINYTMGAEGSWIMEDKEKFGIEAAAGIAELSGAHRLQAKMLMRTEDYDMTDLGFSAPTNFITYLGQYSYQLLQPTKTWNNILLNFITVHRRRLEPDLFRELMFNFNYRLTTKNFFSIGGGFETTPLGIQDIYEPRMAGRHFNIPAYYDVWLIFESDSRKKFGWRSTIDWYKYDERGRGDLILDLMPRYRFSNRLKLQLTSKMIFSDKEEGFVGFEQGDIIFGQRDRNTLENALESQYIFNNKMALDLAFRHYYTEVEYDKFFVLQEDGDLGPQPSYSSNHNTTYNNWNLDLRFSWWFAPGSQLSLLYRNAVDSYIETSGRSFEQNFQNLFEQPQLNMVSLRLNYYLNYNRMKSWFKAKPAPEEFSKQKNNNSLSSF